MHIHPQQLTHKLQLQNPLRTEALQVYIRKSQVESQKHKQKKKKEI